MAYKNAKAQLTTTPAAVYTCPPSRTARVIHCQVANDSDTAATLDLVWDDAGAETSLTGAVAIPPHTSLAPIAGELILEAGDLLKASADAAGRLDLSLSVDEQPV